MRNDFVGAILQIAQDKELSREVIIEAIETALTSTYKRTFGPVPDVRVALNEQTGEIKVFAYKKVVIDVSNEATEISLKEAQTLPTRVEIGEVVEVEQKSASKEFGRIATQTARQVIMQKINEAERDRLYEEFSAREDDIVVAIVQRIEPRGVIMEVGKTEAVLPPAEQVTEERYRVGQRLKVYIKEVQKNVRGMQIIASRTHPNLVKRLFELEVPEIHSGSVEIKSIAREPGVRTKVAVAARQENVDPVGACVGQRGVRIQNVVNELQGEKIDVTQWSNDPRTLVANALRPATVLSVTISETDKSAVVVVPDRELSLAIGKDGQNARLAVRLTKWRIDIRKASEAGALAQTPDPSASGGNERDRGTERKSRGGSRERRSSNNAGGLSAPVATQLESDTVAAQDAHSDEENNSLLAVGDRDA